MKPTWDMRCGTVRRRPSCEMHRLPLEVRALGDFPIVLICSAVDAELDVSIYLTIDQAEEMRDSLIDAVATIEAGREARLAAKGEADD